MKNTRILLVAVITLLILAAPIATYAYSLKTDNTVYIAPGETIEGNLYAFGSSIIIEGTIKGDVFCAGQTVNITGNIEGDIFCAGQAVNIMSVVGGSVRAAGNLVVINGLVANNIQAAGAVINIGPDTTVGWDVLVGGATVDIKGDISGDLHGVAGSLILSGSVGKDVKLRLDERIKGEMYAESYTGPKPFQILPKAEVGGNVYYVSGVSGGISEDATIGGEVGHSIPKKTFTKEDLAMVGAWGRVVFLFAALVVGLVLISVWRKQIKELTDLMMAQAASTIGWGIIITFVTPIIVLLLFLTLIGIPLAVILISLWLIALYLSKIMLGILVGRALIAKVWPKMKESLLWPMIIGVIICWLIYSLPLVGWAATLLAFWWGVGGLWLYFRKTN